MRLSTPCAGPPPAPRHRAPPRRPHAAEGRDAGSSGRNAAVALPWYHITPARTFVAASSLKLLALTLPNSAFPITMAVAARHLVPLGLAQTLAALVGGAALALLARRLDEADFMGTKWAWPAVVGGCALAMLLAARLLPRSETVAAAYRRRMGGGAPATAVAAAREAAPAPARAAPPRLRTAEEAAAEARALFGGSAAPPRRGVPPAAVRR